MNRRELITETARRAEVTKDTAGRVINGFIHTIRKELKDNNSATINGFGRFYLKHYGGRTIRTPQGEERIITERYVPAFRPSNILKNYVRQSH